MQEDIGVSHNEFNHFRFLSSTWYMFPLKAYTYMIQCNKGETVPIGKMVVDVDSQFIKLDRTTDDMECEALKKWKRYEVGLDVRSLLNDEDRLHNKLPRRIHPYSLLLRSGRKLLQCHILPAIHIWELQPLRPYSQSRLVGGSTKSWHSLGEYTAIILENNVRENIG
jgi:hypothetical protein